MSVDHCVSEEVKIGQVFDSKNGQNYIKSISVPETSEHEHGFTLYKIILQVQYTVDLWGECPGSDFCNPHTL